MTLNERSYTILKKTIAALLVIALCLPIGAMTVSAETEQSATPSEPTADAFILDDGTAMTMELSEIETADTGDVYVYEVEYDGILDHTIEVDLENDEAVMTYADGRTETLVISEHVRVTKIQEAGAPSFSSVAAELLAPTPIDSPVLTSSGDYINYIYNTEPFEIDANGNPLPIGNFQYGFGYELVGIASFTNPNEKGYLMRKYIGRDNNEAYYFDITAGTALSLLISTFGTFFGFTPGYGPIISVMSLLVSSLITIVDGVINENASGLLTFWEYQWSYRVRRDPYEATLLETTKSRFFWEMQKIVGEEIITSYAERTDIVDGCQYSNFDIVAAGLGRIVLYF